MAFQRARKVEDKAERRATILDSALKLSAAQRYDTITLTDVAASAGLAKATLFLYFPSKEALYLAVLERELQGYFDALDARLDAGGRWSPRRIVDSLVGAMRERPALPRLFALQEATLEHNIEFERALAFKSFLLRRTQATAARLAKRLPTLADAECMRFMVLARAMLIGLWQMADVSPVVARVLATPGMSVFNVDFFAVLKPALETMLTGLEQDSTRYAK